MGLKYFLWVVFFIINSISLIDSVNVRIPKPIENFYKNLSEPKRGYTEKHDFNRLR